MNNLERIFLVCCASAGCSHNETPPKNVAPISDVAYRVERMHEEIAALHFVRPRGQIGRDAHEAALNDPQLGSPEFRQLYNELTGWMKELRIDDLDEILKADNAIVYVGAEWCAPCLEQGRNLKDVVTLVGDQVSFSKITWEKNPREPQLWATLKIDPSSNIPILVFISHGEIMEQIVGLMSRDEILERLAR